jgi:hypothetical protein
MYLLSFNVVIVTIATFANTYFHGYCPFNLSEVGEIFQIGKSRSWEA